MPCHHTLEAYLHDYQELALVKQKDKAPLFQSTGRGQGGQLTGRRLSRQEAYAMVEHAQQMAAHESPRITKLYDRPADTISNLVELF